MAQPSWRAAPLGLTARATESAARARRAVGRPSSRRGFEGNEVLAGSPRRSPRQRSAGPRRAARGGRGGPKASPPTRNAAATRVAPGRRRRVPWWVLHRPTLPPPHRPQPPRGLRLRAQAARQALGIRAGCVAGPAATAQVAGRALPALARERRARTGGGRGRARGARKKRKGEVAKRQLGKLPGVCGVWGRQGKREGDVGPGWACGWPTQP